jgi:hypothetical protein
MEQPNSGGTKATSNPDRWKPGKYKAKPVDWMATKTQAGLPQVTVLFEYEQDGDMPGKKETRQLSWYGSFKGGALERTIESLEMLGLRQPPYPAMESGREGGALDVNAEVEIVVEHRIHNGVRRAGVAWVNRVGGRAMESKLEAGEGQQVFAEANQAFLAYMQQKGIQPKAAAPAAAAAQPGTIGATPPPQGNLGDDDIPF